MMRAGRGLALTILGIDASDRTFHIPDRIQQQRRHDVSSATTFDLLSLESRETIK